MSARFPTPDKPQSKSKYHSPLAVTKGPQTRESSANVLTHLVTRVLKMDANSKAFHNLKFEGIDNIIHFLDFGLDGIDQMEYIGTEASATTEPIMKPLPKADKRKLKQLFKMVKYLHQKNKSLDWAKLTADDLEAFLWEVAPTIGAEKTEAEKFVRNVKFDIQQYPKFE